MIQDLTLENWIVIGKVFGLLIATNFFTYLISKWQNADSHIRWEYFIGSTFAGMIYLLTRWIIIGSVCIFALLAFLQWLF